MSATLAEAATLLLCRIFGALHPLKCSRATPRHPSTPPLDAATQTTPHIAISQDVATTQLPLEEFSLRCVHPHNPSVLCTTCSRPVSSLLLDAAVQTPCSVATADAITQLPLTEFLIACVWTLQIAKDHHLHIGMQAAPQLHNPLTLLRFAVPAAPATLATVTTTLRPHVCHHSRNQVSRSMPTCAPHMVAC